MKLLSTLAVISTLLLSGCTTIKLKAGFMSYQHWGDEYTGTVCNLKYLSFIATEQPEFLVFAPFLIVDVPLSLVADTVVLPFDLAAENKATQYECRIAEF